MKEHTFKLENGQEVILSENDMQKVHQYFEVQSTADYLRENHNWPEDTIQKVALVTRTIMNEADDGAYTENEAIAEALDELGIEEGAGDED